jgi:predicted DNA-binding protein (MmcQ/YjbR family)
VTLSGPDIRAYCLDLPATTEDYPFGRNPEICTFKVVGKVFALIRLSAPPPMEVSLKCDPQIAVNLRSNYPAIVPGYHLNKRHWNTVTVDESLPDRLVFEMIQDSFDLVVDGLPREVRIKLR